MILCFILADVNIKATLKGEPEAKGGKTFFKIKEFKFDLNVGRAIIHLNNLFNGNKELGKDFTQI